MKQRVVINISAENVVVEHQNNRTYGDIYTNVAIMLSIHKNKSPVEIAGMLAKRI